MSRENFPNSAEYGAPKHERLSQKFKKWLGKLGIKGFNQPSQPAYTSTENSWGGGNSWDSEWQTPLSPNETSATGSWDTPAATYNESAWGSGITPPQSESQYLGGWGEPNAGMQYPGSPEITKKQERSKKRLAALGATVLAFAIGGPIAFTTYEHSQHDSTSASASPFELSEPTPEIAKDLADAGGEECEDLTTNAAETMSLFTETLPTTPEELAVNAEGALADFENAKNATEFIPLPANYQELRADLDLDEPTIDGHVYDQTAKEYLKQFNIKLSLDWDTPKNEWEAWRSGIPTVEDGVPLSKHELKSADHKATILGMLKSFSESPASVVKNMSLERIYVGKVNLDGGEPSAFVRTIAGSETPKIMFIGDTTSLVGDSIDPKINNSQYIVDHEMGHATNTRTPNEKTKLTEKCIRRIFFGLNKLVKFKYGDSLGEDGIDKHGNRTLESTPENQDEVNGNIVAATTYGTELGEDIAEGKALVGDASDSTSLAFNTDNGNPKILQEKLSAEIAGISKVDPKAGKYYIAKLRLMRYVSALHTLETDDPRVAEAIEKISAALPSAS